MKNPIHDEMVHWVRDQIFSAARAKLCWSTLIPKIASRKSMRGTLRRIAQGEIFVAEPVVVRRLIDGHEVPYSERDRKQYQGSYGHAELRTFFSSQISRPL